MAAAALRGARWAFGLAAVVFLMGACGPSDSSAAAPTSTVATPPQPSPVATTKLPSPNDKEQARDCPRLDSQLFQLSRSGDPQGFAAQAGLDLGSSGVRVVIELRWGAELPSGHGLTVEARYANLVQARAPIANLCALAQEAGVASVAPPARGVPQPQR